MRNSFNGKYPINKIALLKVPTKKLTKTQREAEIARLTRQMKEAAKLLEFELAAEIRDQIKQLEGK